MGADRSGQQVELKTAAATEDFVATTWKITMADGVVTDIEKKRLLEIVDVLALEMAVLPAAWAQIVQASKAS